MPSEGEQLIPCYNRGCGQTFDPNENKEDSCSFHPGTPVFHDAYKGWSCCKKKCTDFTEFLNIKGCTRSYHCNVKPEVPETHRPNVEPTVPVVTDNTVSMRISQPTLPRPAFDTPLVKLKPEVAPALEQLMKKIERPLTSSEEHQENCEVCVGMPCLNKGCGKKYEGPDIPSQCVYHPGCAIFHEGLKYWSCCKRLTSDFETFMGQQGCHTGEHVYKKEMKAEDKVNCRYDWHQTSNYVVVSVFAKQYDPSVSTVEVNPIRLKVNMYFPAEDYTYKIDLELKGVIDVEQCGATMMQTKLEVRLRKAEVGSWAKLNIPRLPPEVREQVPEAAVQDLESEVDAVDLSDL